MPALDGLGILVVEDEQSHPFSLLTISAGGRVTHSALTPGWLQLFSDFWALDDLEGRAGTRERRHRLIPAHCLRHPMVSRSRIDRSAPGIRPPEP